MSVVVVEKEYSTCGVVMFYLFLTEEQRSRCWVPVCVYYYRASVRWRRLSHTCVETLLVVLVR